MVSFGAVVPTLFAGDFCWPCRRDAVSEWRVCDRGLRAPRLLPLSDAVGRQCARGELRVRRPADRVAVGGDGCAVWSRWASCPSVWFCRRAVRLAGGVLAWGVVSVCLSVVPVELCGGRAVRSRRASCPSACRSCRRARRRAGRALALVFVPVGLSAVRRRANGSPALGFCSWACRLWRRAGWRSRGALFQGFMPVGLSAVLPREAAGALGARAGFRARRLVGRVAARSGGRAVRLCGAFVPVGLSAVSAREAASERCARAVLRAHRLVGRAAARGGERTVRSRWDS